MAEPSSSAAGGFLAWKALGGMAAVAGLAAALAAVVVMCAKRPRDGAEWTVGIISTVVSSLSLGAYAVLKMGMLDNLPTEPVPLLMAVMSMGGVMFASGLPGWALVRATFTWLSKNDGKDIAELAQEARADAAKTLSP